MNYLKMNLEDLFEILDKTTQDKEDLMNLNSIYQNKIFDYQEEIKALRDQIKFLNNHISDISKNKIINFIDPNINS